MAFTLYVGMYFLCNKLLRLTKRIEKRSKIKIFYDPNYVDIVN